MSVMWSRGLRRHVEARLASVPRGPLWVYLVAAAFFNFGFSLFFFLFNLYLLGFGFNERMLGFVGSAMAAGTLCGTLPVGVALQKFGLRWTLLCTIGLACLASVLRILCVWQPVQIPLAVACGLGLSAWGVCLSPAVASLTTDDQRQRGFSITFAFGIGLAGLGALAAGFLPGFLQRTRLAPDLAHAERYVLLLAVTVASLSLIPLSGLSLPPPPPRLRLVPPTSSFLRTFLPAIAVWSLVTGALPPFASVFFVHHLGLSLQAMGSIFSLSQAIQFGAILGAPFLFRRIGSGHGILLTQLTTAAALLLLTAARSATSAGWLYWVYMGAQCMNEPALYGLLMDRVPAEDRGGASSYAFFVTAAAHIVASAVVGILIVRVGYSFVLCGAGGLAVVAALLFRRLTRSKLSDTAVEARPISVPT